MTRTSSTSGQSTVAPAVRIGLALLLAFPAAALASHSPSRLERLVEEEQFEQAYEYALEHRAAHEGEPRFDFYYGLAALQTGDLKEGVFALERVLALEPGFDRARLELARGYFMLEDDRRAKREFEIVLAHDPPPNVRSHIESYLAALQRRADRYETTVTGFVELGGGHDTNVNSATASDSVAILGGLLDVVLDEDSREKDDNFTRFEARANVSHPLSPGLNLVAGAGLWNRWLDTEDEFETGAVDGTLGLMWRGAKSRTLLTTQAQRFYLDGDAYRELLGVGASYRRDVSEVFGFDLSGRVSQLDYVDDDTLDSTLGVIDIGISRRLDHERRPVITAGLFLGREEADEDTATAQANAERDIAGARAGLWMILAPSWTLQGSLEFRRSEYAEENPLFLETRETDYYAASLSADWRPSTHWRAGPQLKYSNSDSTIEIYEYERTEVWVRARYEFY